MPSDKTRKFLEWQKNFRAANPWYRMREYAMRRCTDPKYKNYARYGGRGIKCLLTVSDMRLLWERDRGHELEWPSLDRIDKDKNYCFENCRIIEQRENSNYRKVEEPTEWSD